MSSKSAPCPPAAAQAGGGLKIALAALALFALSGCASVWVVDNQVQSFAHWSEPAAAPAAAVPQPPQSYRFERLPSQREGRAAAAQDELERLTRAALGEVGWTLADAAAPAPWTVQVAARTQYLARAPWEDHWGLFWGTPWSGFDWPGRGHVITGGGQIVWAPVFPPPQPPQQQREVSLLIRQAADGRVVFESRAVHDGRWNASPALWRAMLDAALRDFPAPPHGLRRVEVELAR
ncbi:hypothetical protein [Hydrogenophaga sp.]|uniref:hypothetical protein n=1 Tax=Hydrogenophaga sp. TaxID=1904254 RepID=UPI0019C87E03|nr:hypothetical protein [Hydrogenophaga sp.]MBD3894215.1 hypothetical protein [Hydrogenophaga sp.]